MERKHADILRLKFPEALQGKPVVTLRIPDNFQFLDHILPEPLRVVSRSGASAGGVVMRGSGPAGRSGASGYN